MKCEFQGVNYDFEFPLEQLKVDPDYQRALFKKGIKTNLADFDPLAFFTRPIVASLRKDGSYYNIDGLHRQEIAKQKGMATGVVAIVSGLTRQKEAKLFTVLNNVKPVTKQDKFRAYYCAGISMYRQIVAIIKESGFGYAEKPGKPTANANIISQVATIEEIFKKGESVLRDTLRVIKTCFTDQEGIVETIARERVMLKGVAYYLEIGGTANDAIANLRGTTALDLVAKVKEQNQMRNKAHLWKYVGESISEQVRERREVHDKEPALSLVS